jgi:hypothetical protein
VVVGVHDEPAAQEFAAAVELEPAVKILNNTSYTYKTIHNGTAFYAIQNRFRAVYISN